ncbi:hypothetical protein BKA65DRAFT_127737 [Rhexocercosporidium sp. MPI-PUGE-AT-0058]|nr:hypothetical protein BKA65DRAFT_127737 [Rhexocercosporidium sp. MPI-PUGE-AT-0058]
MEANEQRDSQLHSQVLGGTSLRCLILWHIRGGLFSILSNATCYRKAKSRSQEEPASRAALSICGDVYLMLRSFNLSSTNLPCSNRFTLPLFPSLMLVALEFLFPPFRLSCLNLYTSCLGRHTSGTLSELIVHYQLCVSGFQVYLRHRRQQDELKCSQRCKTGTRKLR